MGIRLETLNNGLLLNIEKVNQLLVSMKFLLDVNSKNLSLELYKLLKNQISVSYDGEHKFLDITKKQVELLNFFKFDFKDFLKEPFCVDFVNLVDIGEVYYKVIDKESNISRVKEDIFLNEDIGLGIITGYGYGHIGKGVYGCDTNDENSYCFVNSAVSARANILSRSSVYELNYVEGKFVGKYKKCLLGKLEGILLLVDGTMYNSEFDKESLDYYTSDENCFVSSVSSFEDIEPFSYDFSIIKGAKG